MNKLLSQSVLGLFALVTLTLISTSSCKKKPNTKDPDPITKTLTKSFLYDKTWYSKGGIIVHKFNSNGTYGTIGKWNWMNNSDSMFVDYNSGSDYVHYFEWSTEHECSIAIKKNDVYTLYKDYKW